MTIQDLFEYIKDDPTKFGPIETTKTYSENNESSDYSTEIELFDENGETYANLIIDFTVVYDVMGPIDATSEDDEYYHPTDLKIDEIKFKKIYDEDSHTIPEIKEYIEKNQQKIIKDLEKDFKENKKITKFIEKETEEWDEDKTEGNLEAFVNRFSEEFAPVIDSNFKVKFDN